jgi:hypothetical protein
MIHPKGDIQMRLLRLIFMAGVSIMAAAGCQSKPSQQIVQAEQIVQADAQSESTGKPPKSVSKKLP